MSNLTCPRCGITYPFDPKDIYPLPPPPNADGSINRGCWSLTRPYPYDEVWCKPCYLHYKKFLNGRKYYAVNISSMELFFFMKKHPTAPDDIELPSKDEREAETKFFLKRIRKMLEDHNEDLDV